MVKNPDLDAIVVVSPSMFHAEHIKLALDAGKHCFCDKPLDTTVEKCKLAEKAVEAHPDKVFMLGFMRRLMIPTQRPSAASMQATSARSFSSDSYTPGTPRSPPSRVRSSLHRTPAASIWICACMTST